MSRSAGATPYARRRRPRLLRWVFLALLVVPVVEIAVIIGVGKVVGGWPTVALLLAESALGAWIVRREGSRSWAALREALASGRMPSRELTDAALVLVGGTLLLTPGFVTDLAGFLLILPATRPLTRQWLEAVVARRLLGSVGDHPPRPPRTAGPQDPPDVVEGEVVR